MSYKDNVRIVIDRLIALEGGSQAAFARKAGVSPQVVSNWVKRKNCPDIDTIGLISEAYGIPIGNFLANRIDWAALEHGDQQPELEYAALALSGEEELLLENYRSAGSDDRDALSAMASYYAQRARARYGS